MSRKKKKRSDATEAMVYIIPFSLVRQVPEVENLNLPETVDE